MGDAKSSHKAMTARAVALHPSRPTSARLDALSAEALLGLIAEQHVGALGELYDRFGTIAYSLANAILRNPTLAADAVQDAFLALWRSGSSFDPAAGSAQSWLVTLVRRRAIDIVRREQVRYTEPLGDFDQPLAESSDEAVWIRDRRRAVQRALAELPPEQRRMLELAYYGGLTQTQLAEVLGVPLGTVKSRSHTALTRLRELLGELAA